MATKDLRLEGFPPLKTTKQVVVCTKSVQHYERFYPRFLQRVQLGNAPIQKKLERQRQEWLQLMAKKKADQIAKQQALARWNEEQKKMMEIIRVTEEKKFQEFLKKLYEKQTWEEKQKTEDAMRLLEEKKKQDEAKKIDDMKKEAKRQAEIRATLARQTLLGIMEKLYESYREVDSAGQISGKKCLKTTEAGDYLSEEVVKDGKLLYGEILPEGLDSIAEKSYLNLKCAKTVHDLGMGLGKTIIWAFLAYPNITRAHGVEMSKSRFALAEKAAIILTKMPGFKLITHISENYIEVQTMDGMRSLCLRRGNLFDETGIEKTDAIIFNTCVPESANCKVVELLKRMRSGVRMLSWMNVRGTMTKPSKVVKDRMCPRVKTSWLNTSGHSFYLSERV